MALPFRRPARPSDWEPGAQAGPDPSLTLREWEVAVILCSLSVEVQKALVDWLLAPRDLNCWPPPATFERRCLPFQEGELHGKARADRCALLYEELKAIRQTLDFPPGVLSGLTRNGLLVAHGIRLRQLERWLWPVGAAREIKKVIGQRAS
jgi:hypothetical protein